ncbi:MAG TPA: peptidoglycan-associated lipoprotein Pal [Thermoanaerobaculia bacterium]|nr:peptidoglycan-associated lipoprotein Pal [Thermoanaerobaculia bacterium]
MTRKTAVALLMVLAVLAVGACKKKNPNTTPDMVIKPSTVEPQATEVSSRPEPTIGGDQTPDPLAGDLQEASEYAARQGLLGDVFFDYDQYDLRQDARERLAQNAKFLTSHPEFILTIEGHADERGTNDYNLALGERRANAAKEYLATLGVGADRLRTVSYGEERPFCSESNEGCWSQNRRAHFTITGRTNVG